MCRFTFTGSSTYAWSVTTPKGGHTGTGTYTFDSSTSAFSFTNTVYSPHNTGDPNFDACLDIDGTYTLDFSADCDSVVMHVISDSCPVRVPFTLAKAGTQCPPPMMSTTGTSTGTSGGGGCSALSACCAMVPANITAACNSVAQSEDASLCSMELSAFQEAGYCQ